VFFPAQFVPQPSRMFLVESVAPGQQAHRFRVRVPSWSRSPAGGSITGQVLGRLAPDRAYDIEIRAAHGPDVYVSLPRAFTARAPRFTTLQTTSAARGETVFAQVDFAPPPTRFLVNGRAAAVTTRQGDGVFAFTVPAGAPLGDATVTAVAPGMRLDAPQTLTILATGGEFAAVVDGLERTCASIGYHQDPASQTIRDQWGNLLGPKLVLEGSRAVLNNKRDVNHGFTVELPVDLAALTLPVTFTEADGAVVKWFNENHRGPMWLAGPRHAFDSTTCTVTLTSLDGTRLHGSFAAHMHDVVDLGHDPQGIEFELTDGRFTASPETPPAK
jgi:hypothetical protein